MQRKCINTLYTKLLPKSPWAAYDPKSDMQQHASRKDNIQIGIMGHLLPKQHRLNDGKARLAHSLSLFTISRGVYERWWQMRKINKLSSVNITVCAWNSLSVISVHLDKPSRLLHGRPLENRQVLVKSMPQFGANARIYG